MVNIFVILWWIVSQVYAKTHQTLHLFYYYYFIIFKIWSAPQICVVPAQAHANPLCIVPILVYVLLKGSQTVNLNVHSLLYINIPQLAVEK